MVVVGRMLTSGLDEVWDRVTGRMEGMGDDEYLWEPVPGAWSVRAAPGGGFTVDRVVPEPEPAPVTTIAWRTWHIAVECLDSYSRRAFPPGAGGGAAGPDVEDGRWVGTAAEAAAALDAAWATFRGAVGALDEEAMARPLGPAFGPYADSSYAELVLHAYDEIVHHGAEIALLRDLWRSGGADVAR